MLYFYSLKITIPQRKIPQHHQSTLQVYSTQPGRALKRIFYNARHAILKVIEIAIAQTDIAHMAGLHNAK